MAWIVLASRNINRRIEVNADFGTLSGCRGFYFDFDYCQSVTGQG